MCRSLFPPQHARPARLTQSHPPLLHLTPTEPVASPPNLPPLLRLPSCPHDTPIPLPPFFLSPPLSHPAGMILMDVTWIIPILLHRTPMVWLCARLPERRHGLRVSPAPLATPSSDTSHAVVPAVQEPPPHTAPTLMGLTLPAFPPAPPALSSQIAQTTPSSAPLALPPTAATIADPSHISLKSLPRFAPSVRHLFPIDGAARPSRACLLLPYDT